MNEKSNKNIIALPGRNIFPFFGGLLFFILWILIYTPRVQELHSLKINFNDSQTQIQTIEDTIARGKSLNEGVRRLKELSQTLETKFPQREEEGLRLISDLARSNHVEILSLKIQPKNIMLDSEQKEIKIQGRSSQTVLVVLEMKGNFKDLVRYLDVLKDKVPNYLTVEQLKISKETAEATILNISLEIYLYFLN